LRLIYKENENIMIRRVPTSKNCCLVKDFFSHFFTSILCFQADICQGRSFASSCNHKS